MPKTKRKQATKTKPVKSKVTRFRRAVPVIPLIKHEEGSVSLPVVGVDGKIKGHMSAPASLFGAKVNAQLLAQAVRVYLSNQREGSASTKTRGEVEGSTRKIYRQKGTGRARHGAIRAPIFVGGGIVFGPRPHSFRLELPKKMRRVALGSALSRRREEESLRIVDGLETVEPKTKVMVKTLESFNVKRPILMVLSGEGAGSIIRAARNIAGVDILDAKSLNTYMILAHQGIVMTRDAVKTLKETFTPHKPGAGFAK